MAKSTLDSVYFFHQVDRDPVNGAFGNNYINIKGLGNIIVKSVNVEKNSVTTEYGEITISDKNKSDKDFFMHAMGKRWDSLKNGLVYSPNYSDYMPAYICSIQLLFNIINDIPISSWGDKLYIYR
jgi:hypothetical protein